jgi:DNA-binding response OmpR family regulator
MSRADAEPSVAGETAAGLPGGIAAEILVAEHEPAVAELIRRYLAREGLRVRCTRTAEETAAALAGCRAAAVVLDLTMPDLDAREIRKLIRGQSPPRAAATTRPPVTRPAATHSAARTARAVPGAPVICLTAGEGTHAAAGLRPRDVGVGQESCLSRPFGPRTLVSRVRAAARTQPQPPAAAYTAGRLRLEPAARRVTLGETEIMLTGTEFDLLSCLMHQAGRTVSRDRLKQAVWGRNGENGGTGGRAVDVYIAQLRAKLGPGNGIRTVRGIGYVLDPGAMNPGPGQSPAGLQPGGRAKRPKPPATIVGAGLPIRGDSGTA